MVNQNKRAGLQRGPLFIVGVDTGMMKQRGQGEEFKYIYKIVDREKTRFLSIYYKEFFQHQRVITLISDCVNADEALFEILKKMPPDDWDWHDKLPRYVNICESVLGGMRKYRMEMIYDTRFPHLIREMKRVRKSLDTFNKF